MAAKEDCLFELAVARFTGSYQVNTSVGGDRVRRDRIVGIPDSRRWVDGGPHSRGRIYGDPDSRRRVDSGLDVYQSVCGANDDQHTINRVV